MMFKQKKALLRVALAAILAGVGFGPVGDAQAQDVTYYYSSPILHTGSLHYHRIYQRSEYHWTPALGWHWHDYYLDVPHRVPGNYAYRPNVGLPVITY